MFLLVPAHPDCPRQNPKSCETVVCVSLRMLTCSSVRWNISHGASDLQKSQHTLLLFAFYFLLTENQCFIYTVMLCYNSLVMPEAFLST